MEEDISLPSTPIDNNPPNPVPLTEGDPNILLDFVLNVLPFTLDANPSDLDLSLKVYSDTLDQMHKFCNDAQTHALYIVKQLPSGGISEDGTGYTYSAETELKYSFNHAGTFALIKKSQTIDTSRSIQSQLQFINLPGPANDQANPYEALHSYLHHAVSPFFNAFVSAKTSQDSAAKKEDTSLSTGIPLTQKKFAELELSLLHLQQNVDIPEVSLVIHPLVQKTVQECQSKKTKVTVEAIDADLLSDTTFLNKLQGDVNSWIKEIQKVTKLSRDPTNGSALQEINFWLNMEQALEKIDHQLKSDEIVLTMDILKNAKRFHATVSFMADTGLNEASDRVFKYNQLMKEFPINELLSSPDIEGMCDALVQIFNHLNKKLKISPYPVKRALYFVESISRDFNEQLLKLLNTRRLMYIDYKEFEAIMVLIEELFKTWDDMIKEFTTVGRDIIRKRNEKFFLLKFNFAHSKLQERLLFIKNFRHQDDQLQTTIIQVMAQPNSFKRFNNNDITLAEESMSITDLNAVEEVRLAYEIVKHVDVLDVTPEGTETWVAAESSYNEKVSKVENQIISKLRDRLATAKNANEMFRVFSKFNALFVRPKIRGAIQEYQTQLIESVKKDIEALHNKFKLQYRNTEANHMSQLRDIPNVSGTIIWVKQIERQLSQYMKRVEDVLGKGWEQYADGQKLDYESNSFRKKLDTKPICDNWIAEIQQRDLQISGRIFNITRNRAQNNEFVLGINFDPQVITLFKETRNLILLGHTIPHSIRNWAKDAKRVYPYAVGLMETVRTYSQVVHRIQSNPQVSTLVSSYYRDVQELVANGINLRWDFLINTYDTHRLSYSLSGGGAAVAESTHFEFVQKFASMVSLLQEKVEAVLSTNSEINSILKKLQSCPYEKQILQDYLNQIQVFIDRLNFESYSNLEAWVKYLNEQVESVFITRLQNALKAWIEEFSSTKKEAALTSQVSDKYVSRLRRKLLESQPAEEETTEKIEYKPSLPILIHEILIQNQVMYLEPPIEHAKSTWYSELHSWLSVICYLPKLQGARYDLKTNFIDEDPRNATFIGLLTKIKDNSLYKAYKAIETKTEEVVEYVKIWLQYQSLWDLETDVVYQQLGDDLFKWQQIISEIKKARNTFDNSETNKGFGAIIIDYEQVQSKVNSKYDQWQKEILKEFGSKLGQGMKEFHSAVSKSRVELEQFSIETNTTSETVTFITFVQDLKRKVKKWTSDVDLFRQGQKTLERQRYQFSADWLYVDQVDNEWSAFNEILSRKNSSIQDQVASLQMKIIAEDKVVAQKITDIVAEWDQNKPIQGSIKPDIANNTLSIFEGRLTRLKQEFVQVSQAKEALDLASSTDDRLDPILEELQDLKAVWVALSKVWSTLFEVRDIPWASVVPRKIRQSLDQLLQETNQMPSRMRQYAAFEYIQETLKSYLKINLLLTDLKSEALRERHWKNLFKLLKVEGKFLFSEMTLGHLWDLDLKKNESIVREVIVVAQGEMALEEFLRQVRETWTGYSLELVNYQNKCRLIKGWDELMAKCSENLNSLTAMKMSPYYKVFEEEASGWEDKLNRIHVLFFDVWIDVQRQWVYLEGIFTGSADIKHLLPMETSRFQNINTEFLAVMKKVYKAPFILDVLNIPNILKSLERLKDLLSKIQKALGEYLEKERSSFPRFYFVGDEDLLEIIGNSKDVVRIQKHFKKMFAGIANILLNEDATEILGMASKEGEEVIFKKPVSIKENPRINDWLTLLEKEMKNNLALLLADSVNEIEQIYLATDLDSEAFIQWIDKYPAQLVVLALQHVWTKTVEESLEKSSGDANNMSHFDHPFGLVERGLTVLADAVLTDLHVTKRKKCEHLITELVHQRDVIRLLIKGKVTNSKDFNWLYQMRFYFNPSAEKAVDNLVIRMANANFFYGYEYLGVPDRLVQTPLTDRCYLTLTQALESRLGGSPFGPAGTGKTESVKALGVQLGRFVLVFCCDENFDFQAMGRIFVGLCQVGAWGCFDEFNRLEEKILSAVSQQIQTIQLGLKSLQSNSNTEIDLVGKSVKIHGDTGIFITMNPGYAGRSNLPDNLKKLFRSMAMTKPDRELIAQVMLYSQGFRSAELLASKVVPLFVLCSEQLSPQSHYDFGLRALKSVLVSAGNLKRDRLTKLRQAIESEESPESITSISEGLPEQEILIQSVRETLVPKLVSEDIPLLKSLMSDVFPGVDYCPVDLDKLKDAINEVCKERRLVVEETWLEKVIQLYQIQNIHHGLMMVGPSGSGKSVAWQVLLTALERVEGVEGVPYVIDPKAMSKEALYGSLDPTTREWTDGLFTHILRKILDNVRGENLKRHWIIFDGDVDPEWVENLNSVLDDNRLLTLPNGERLNLPPNVRVMFEVENLQYATLATVSRCGMVWFSEDIVTLPMLFSNYLQTLSTVPLSGEGDDEAIVENSESTSSKMATQLACVKLLEPFFEEGNLVSKSLDQAASLTHIMDFTPMRALNTLFSLVNKAVRNVITYNNQHPDFPMTGEHFENYIVRKLILSIVWSFSGDSKLDYRAELGDFVRGITTVDMPVLEAGGSIIDYDVSLNDGEWALWQTRVPTIEIETHTVSQADVVVPTIDTVRHEEVLYSWLSEHKPLLLCGPPGSGKTMTLFSALRKLPDMEVVGLNFSSATTPELIMKTFEQYCEYRKTPNGVLLSPTMLGRWLVVFCDEINLPATDKYGTQRVISFLRQLIEHGGYWRTSDKSWVQLERIQFVGACNPPTDPGRVPLSHRFMRHAPLVMVDYPGEISLNQIYSTFARAMLKVVPELRGHTQALTAAMVDLYLASQKRFTPDIQAHYIYSPRELTRWMRGIYEAIKPMESLSLEGLVRIWAHEALRLFQDRLVTDEERKWTDDAIDEIALKHFPTLDKEEALTRPILFSNWLSKYYIPVSREELRDYTKARLKVFYEEELDVPLVLFNDVLDHVLRIDRVFRQMQGHLLLIGVSGSGKTTLSRFVAWMNGLSVFQIKAHNKYTGDDFDEDLRTVLRRAGCKGEKICFIMDESNVLDSGFLERMNTLLANAEVPGLFEGDEYSALMTQCKESASKEGLMLDSGDELYKWFTQQVMKNLHVVFTMNPPEGGLASRAATSPALFNRCVLDWFGDWSDQAFFQVGSEFTHNLDLDLQNFECPTEAQIVYSGLSLPASHREIVVNAFVYIHQTLYEINAKLSKRQGRHNHVTPRHYLDFINHYVKLYHEKRDDLEEQQRHLNIGLDKLKDTVVKVEELRKSLAVKKTELEAKNIEANEKLKKMVADQQEAEQKKSETIKIQSELEIKNKAIAERKVIVMEDLAKAEPAVIEAQNSVRNIKKQQLTEVRSMANPPAPVKLCMEAVCILLGHKIDSWKTVQGVLRRDDFISSIENFDTNTKITKAIRDKMNKEYLSNPNFNFETMNRASKACGPLVQWAIAQVNFASILDKVGPLRKEVEELEKSAEETQVMASKMEKMVTELESSIAIYKDEYAVLISQTQAIKSEMERVKSKVDRSLTLLSSLSSEKERWETSSQAFDTQMATIVGDVLLSAAYMAYGGYFDQQYREILFGKWTSHLIRSSIQFKQDISLTEYLSTADERLSWQADSLPADDLCIENAIMLKRFNRYPLIIDPSGQATAFLANKYKDQKITVTSFLDDAFLKNLESALRFGNPLLIQDVENLDPIINPVLNRELRRTGGRVLIRLGGQDIDFSPSFTLFLSTRDPSVNFPPDVCSRVTFVNFTVTKGSLQVQCLNKVLKSESPETDQKRSDLIKLQGEFRLRLRHLEKSLLQALSESKGNILDDDNVIETLETLKKEAAEVTQKVEETDTIMQEVEAVTAVYTPLAQSCSSLFFIMDQLNLLNHFYQFSLDFFYDIFNHVINRENPNLKGITDQGERLDILTRDLFTETYRRTSLTLLHRDHIVFATLLAQIRIKNTPNQVDDSEYDFLTGGSDVVLSKNSEIDKFPQGLFTEEQARAIVSLSKVSSFSNIIFHVNNNADAWASFVNDTNGDLNLVPECWENEDSSSPVIDALRKVLVIKCIHPDLVISGASSFIDTVFGKDFQSENDLNFKHLTLEEISASTPVALCSVPGYDASYRVDNLASEVSARCTSVAMGSAEGFSLADQAISSAIKSGNWVLLKNVHLAPSWLGQLEKKLHSMKPHKSFRLFLTMETNPKVPVNLLRMSRVLLFEPPPGIKANLHESLSSISPSRFANGPIERVRLHFLLAWLHAVVQERLRYVPLGWSKTYEFNDADLNCGLNTIDIWLDSVAQGRSNLSPDKIPWDALRSLVSQSVYGGKIDNEFDQKLLDSFVKSLFTPKSYEFNFALVDKTKESEALAIPDGTKIDQFVSWVNTLPDIEPPNWLGLPSNAMKVLLTQNGQQYLSKVLKMKSISDDDEQDSSQGSTSKDSSSQPAWMRSLQTSCESWLGSLPEKLDYLPRTPTSAANPLFRVFDRENSIGRKLLKTVRDDLKNLILVCKAEIKQTNHLRQLMDTMVKGLIPSHWKKYKVSSDTSLINWVANFNQRLDQLADINAKGLDINFAKYHVWLGGLFFPEAYITATRQFAAQKHQWSLEELVLQVGLGKDASNDDAFVIQNLKLEGANIDSANNCLELASDAIQTKIPTTTLTWIKKQDTETSTPDSNLHALNLPVYLNHSRSELLFTFDCFGNDNWNRFSQRGVGLTAA